MKYFGEIKADKINMLTREQANMLKEKIQKKSEVVKSQNGRRSGRLSVAEINEVINNITERNKI